MRLLVVIPAFNEEESLPAVLQDIRSNCPQYDVLVVNDGSIDGTADVVRKSGYELLDLPVNLGLAGAFQAGLRYAAQNGYDAAVQFDADGQHLAKYLPPLEARLSEGYDIVIGSRFVNQKRPFTARMIGSRLITFVTRLTTGVRIMDPTSGMRIFNAAMIRDFAHNLNWPPEPDTISYLLRCGAKVCEEPVEVAERTAGTSYLTLYKSMVYMLQITISILLVQWFRKNERRKGGSL